MTEHEKSDARLLHEAQEVASWWKNEAGRRKARILELEEALRGLLAYDVFMLSLTPPRFKVDDDTQQAENVRNRWRQERDEFLGAMDRADRLLTTTEEPREEK